VPKFEVDATNTPEDLLTFKVRTAVGFGMDKAVAENHEARIPFAPLTISTS
jgi:hypothetical protein